MPIGTYFKGKGNQVMLDMQKRYGRKKGTRVFHATATKRGLTSHGTMPKNVAWGDVGKKRQAESVTIGGFTDGSDVCASSRF